MRIFWVMLLTAALAGCQQEPGGAEAPLRQSIGGDQDSSDRCWPASEGTLPPRLLELEDDEEIRQTIDDCLTVDEATARAWALGWARSQLGMQAPLSIRLVRPVVDSRGVLIARQVIITAGDGDQGFEPLRAELTPVIQAAAAAADEETSLFLAVHRLTRDRIATINVSARAFRHPLARAHRGPPRWLVEAAPAIERCSAGQAEPVEILPVAGLPAVVEAVRWRCGEAELLWSAYADGEVAPELLRTRRDPVAAFHRWSRAVRQRYDDPEARLAFTAGLWERFVSAGRQP